MHLHVTAEINHWRVNSGNLHDYRNCGITEVIGLKKLRHYKNYGFQMLRDSRNYRVKKSYTR